MENEAFRAQLIADPKCVIHAEFGIEIPDHYTLQVDEMNDITEHLVLPHSSALSEAELEQVAGDNPARRGDKMGNFAAVVISAD